MTFKAHGDRHDRIKQLKASTQLGLRRNMQLQGTLGLENLGIEKAKPPGKCARRKARKKAILAEQDTRSFTTQPGETATRHGANIKTLCPPAVPEYQALPIPPLGSIPDRQITQAELSSDPRSYCGTTNAYGHQPLQNHVDKQPQPYPRYQPGQGFTPIHGPAATVRIFSSQMPQTKNPFEGSTTAANSCENRPAARPPEQRSSLSVMTYYGLPSFRIDKNYRHSKVVPPASSAATRAGCRTGSPPQTLQHDVPARPKPPQPSRAIFKPPAFNIPSQIHHHSTPHIRHLPAPVPTPTYLNLAHANPVLLPSPERLLLILDLNGTLLQRSTHTKYSARPYLQQFLAYAFANHSLFIWSSAQPRNVSGVCATLFTPSQRKSLVGEWARDTLDLTPAQYKERVQVYKRLDKVWESRPVQRTHPNFTKGEIWGQHNTLLIDDSVLKASAQPFNHVEVPEFVNDGIERKDDPNAVLAQVVGFLEMARKWSDVSAFVRQRKFMVNQGWHWDSTWDERERNEWVEDDDDDYDGGVRVC